ncbi:MAG TPA: SMP-30/gluconolactonase/LRE family protein [Vicinamibacteria bacterium]
MKWAAGLVLALILYLCAWPVPVSPAPWSPPRSPGFAGAYAPNEALAGADRLEVGPGPEDVAVGPDGLLYTGLADGRIVRLRTDGGGLQEFARTGGRPLGLRFAPGGRLVVADAARGLLAVGPGGEVEVLATAHGGVPFRLTDDLDVASDGTVYFSDASSRFGLGDSHADLVEHRASGRLLAWDPRTRATTLLRDDLFFANGVALAPDGSFVLVAETGAYRLRRHWLRGPRAGQADVLLDNLPAFPDGVLGDGRGGFWVALVSPRSGMLDAAHPYPMVKKALMRLPAPLRPGPQRHGCALRVDAEGRVTHTLQDPAGRVALVTNVVAHEGVLFLGTLEDTALFRVARPD